MERFAHLECCYCMFQTLKKTNVLATDILETWINTTSTAADS